ncbi:MAG: DUF1501 domain-containing protein [Pirellulales bacterium]
MNRASGRMAQHPRLTRRTALQAGSIGLLGLGVNHLNALRAEGAESGTPGSFKAKTCIYIFLSGGLGQHDSFDMKPQATETIRGDFKPIATATPGLEICEHLPMLAARSHLWALCRSLGHGTNGHTDAHLYMLTGRSVPSAGFSPNGPTPTDWPSIASIVGGVMPARNNLPPAVALPERLVHYSGRVIPGQFGGLMGTKHDPWFIEASPFHNTSYGAFPTHQFDHQERGEPDNRVFQAPNLNLPEGLAAGRFNDRLSVLASIEQQRRGLEKAAETEGFDRYRQGAISLLSDQQVQAAFDVTRADEATQERYGKNSFGWSLLMARRLVESGVNLVQVNLGNNESWDTHGEAFPHLKDKLFPPTDRAVSALLDDLRDSGLLDSTLIVMAGEFGRTPKISHLPQYYKLPGRDHWGAVQTVFFAGGGVQGGTVVGSSDKIGGYPHTLPQKPENLAATIYQSLGIPPTTAWVDAVNRPHHIYHGDPIPGLLG